MKKITLILGAFVLMAGFTALSAEETISLTGSNTAVSTKGMVRTDYDYLINPAYIGLLEKPQFFFALDNDTVQLKDTDQEKGFRMGWVPTKGIGFLINYYTNSSGTGRTEEENTEINYGAYDLNTGTYNTIDKIVDYTERNRQNSHDLLLHSGFGLSSQLGLAVQLRYAVASFNYIERSYTDTYVDAASPSEGSLDAKGNVRVTENRLLADADNVIGIELEGGLNSPSLLTQAALGFSIHNLRLDGNTYTETESSYSGGADATVLDQETVNEWAGQYYAAGAASTPTSCLAMGSPDTDDLSQMRIGLDTRTELPLEAFQVLIPASVSLSLPLGDLQTVERENIITYDDVTEKETSQTVTETVTAFDPALDMDFTLGGGIRKEFNPGENAALRLEPGLAVSMDTSGGTQTRTETVSTQVDADGDGAYTTAGTDVDTVTAKSGYEYQSRDTEWRGGFSFKISTSWEPVSLLSFHAGYNMGYGLNYTIEETLESGDGGYMFETFTDNLTDANSYDQRRIDGSTDLSDPSKASSLGYGYQSGSGSFGVCVNINENMSLDLAADATSVEINKFKALLSVNY